jgi:hypothetical protein
MKSLLNKFNNIFPSLKFTCEMQNNNSLNFLDLTVINKTNELLKMIVFCDVASCSVAEIDQRFRGAYMAQHPGRRKLQTRRRENLKSHLMCCYAMYLENIQLQTQL